VKNFKIFIIFACKFEIPSEVKGWGESYLQVRELTGSIILCK